MALVRYKLIQAASLAELEEMVNVAYDIEEVKARREFAYFDDSSGLHYFIAGPPTIIDGVFTQWMVNESGHQF